MKTTLAVLADYANVSQEGKLNIMGIFDRILTPSVPVCHPEMRLVIRMEADPVEQNRDHQVEVQCMDSDGNKLFYFGGSINVSRKDNTFGSVAFDQILDFKNLVFSRFGAYTFAVFVNKQLMARIDLELVQRQDIEPSLPGVK